MSGEAYKVVVDRKNCEHCDNGTLWTIEGSDEVRIGMSWMDQETADDICDLMNQAFIAGVAVEDLPDADELDQLRKLAEAVKGSAGLKCPEPSCGDSGCITGVERDSQGDPCPVPVQCEFCYTVPDSVFNRKQQQAAQEPASTDDNDIPF